MKDDEKYPSVENNEEKYPSVELAYDIALKSYEESRHMWEAVNGRIQRLASWMLPPLVAIPIAFEAVGISMKGVPTYVIKAFGIRAS